ncbi:MAG: PepSY domain-containing protein [Verrucomicrobiales bacterium]
MFLSRKPLPPRRPFRRFLVWVHRWVGLLSVLFVLVICATGLVLNHNVELELDRGIIDDPRLLDWYRLGPQGQPLAWKAGDHLLVAWDGRVFLDSVALDLEGAPVSAGKLSESRLAIAFPDRVALVDRGGRLLDLLDQLVLPPGEILRAGASPGGGLAIETSRGTYLLSGLLEAKPLGRADATWFEPGTETVSPELREEIARAWSSEGLSLYHVLLDLHSGRFFGKTGTLLYDLATIAFLLLALTGLYVGLTRRRPNGAGRDPEKTIESRN